MHFACLLDSPKFVYPRFAETHHFVVVSILEGRGPSGQVIPENHAISLVPFSSFFFFFSLFIIYSL